MKDILLIGIVLFVIISLFGDGGVEISPELSPSIEAALNVNYSPDRSVQTTTIEQQTNIDTNIEQQTVIVQPAVSVQSNSGTIANGRPGGSCFLIPGDTIVEQGSNGECQVTNNGQRFFISPAGTRSYLRQQSKEPLVQMLPTKEVVTNDGRLSVSLPYDNVSTTQLKDNFVRNGGSLPFLFGFWSGKEQRDYLTADPKSWR